jgi:short-subunit dehydrogenase
MAFAFAGSGADVVLVARSEVRPRETAQQLRSTTGRAVVTVAADIGAEAGVASVIAAARAAWRPDGRHRRRCLASIARH